MGRFAKKIKGKAYYDFMLFPNKDIFSLLSNKKGQFDL